MTPGTYLRVKTRRSKLWICPDKYCPSGLLAAFLMKQLPIQTMQTLVAPRINWLPWAEPAPLQKAIAGFQPAMLHPLAIPADRQMEETTFIGRQAQIKPPLPAQ